MSSPTDHREDSTELSIDNQARAVAVRWRQDRVQAPTVQAKGRGLMAERILALAREHHIPIQEDKDLVRLLGDLDLGVEIPPTLYRALAEILAHVYRANRRLGSGPNATRD